MSESLRKLLAYASAVGVNVPNVIKSVVGSSTKRKQFSQETQNQIIQKAKEKRERKKQLRI